MKTEVLVKRGSNLWGRVFKLAIIDRHVGEDGVFTKVYELGALPGPDAKGSDGSGHPFD